MRTRETKAHLSGTEKAGDNGSRNTFIETQGRILVEIVVGSRDHAPGISRFLGIAGIEFPGNDGAEASEELRGGGIVQRRLKKAIEIF